MSGPIAIAVLGSTGSIGRQTLEVARRFPEALRVVALAAHSNSELISEQAAEFGVERIALSDEIAAERARALLPGVKVGAGPGAVVALAESAGTDVVVNALVGSAGLRSTLAALDAGARLALANKESLVAAGELVTRRAAVGQMIPVDSEHSALFQCLLGESAAEIARIWLTASGGPFRGWGSEDLSGVTVDQALAHPKWTMGPKISIDSATLMNKGLEVIEAHHLFGTGYDDIEVVVHPQSCIHSMIEFADGSVKAHLGATDMRIPIQYALSYPERWGPPVPPVRFETLAALTFEPADTETFPCLELAYRAGRAGGTLPAVLNAANEIAVEAFLAGRLPFIAIPAVVEASIDAHTPTAADDLDTIESADAWAREYAHETASRWPEACS